MLSSAQYNQTGMIDQEGHTNNQKGVSVPGIKSISGTIPAIDALRSSTSIDEVGQIARSVRVKLDDRFISLQEAFEKLDVKHSGYISKKEFLDVRSLLPIII